jgi:addiction module RelE/StbE family toxin
VIKLVWYKSFIRAFKKTIRKNPELKDKLQEALEIFVNDPWHPILDTHKLSGRLKSHHAFGLGYDFWVVFKFTDHEEVALISMGRHEEVY